MIETRISDESRAVLRLLASRKNVIISGPPGTGKSKLMNEIRDLFEWRSSDSDASGIPDSDFPLPPDRGVIPSWFPSPDQLKDRKTFATVFDQNTKYRDFMRGLVPEVGVAGRFVVTKGTLYRASTHAKEAGNASLVIVDEINRGPAVAAFGSALVGLEPDKRLGSDGRLRSTTQEFEIVGNDGLSSNFALSADLYVLAAMNEADTSVEPLDVAFLRRFAPYRLEPSTKVLRDHLGLTDTVLELPHVAGTATHMYEALAQAWVAVNRQITLARGAAYQLGHGAFMYSRVPERGDLGSAIEYVADAWATLRAHIDEVFFGDTIALVDILHADYNASPFSMEESIFGGQSVRRVHGPIRPGADQLYAVLFLMATSR